MPVTTSSAAENLGVSMFRFYRTVFLVFLFVVASFQHASAQDQSMLDGICKSHPMPAGMVAVGEMESSECEPSEPGKKNAWLIDRVQHNIVACEKPNYGDGYPPAISFLSCDKAYSDTCPPTLDGTANGFRLTTISECHSRGVDSVCLDWDRDKDLWFNPNSGLGGLSNYKTDPFTLLFLGVEKKASDCRDQTGKPDKATYLRNLAVGESVPLCVSHNQWAIEQRVPAYNRQGRNVKAIIVRRFYTPDCPEFRTLNAVVLKAISIEDWEDKTVFMCHQSLLKQPLPGLTLAMPPRRDGQENPIERLRSPKDYERTRNYEVRSIFHDDRCGSDTGLNAYNVKFNETQTD